jgi:DNA-nicking Smr family endonuclease
MDEDVFRLPIDGTLDLHTFEPCETQSVVRDYISEGCRLGLSEVRIIHGRGTGVLRGLVQAVLEAHPDVEAFADDTASHLGATIAWLRRHDRT